MPAIASDAVDGLLDAWHEQLIVLVDGDPGRTGSAGFPSESRAKPLRFKPFISGYLRV
jgi:hypothetical protein